MIAATEQQQHRVAAELQQITVVGVGDRAQRLEDVVEDVGELLRTYLAASRQPLCQWGEARYVGENDRPVDRRVHLVGRMTQPTHRGPADVRRQYVVLRMRVRQQALSLSTALRDCR